MARKRCCRNSASGLPEWITVGRWVGGGDRRQPTGVLNYDCEWCVVWFGHIIGGSRLWSCSSTNRGALARWLLVHKRCAPLQ